MQKELKHFLLKLDLTDDETESLKMMAPMFENITLEEFTEDMIALIHYGYPQEDISSLLLVNPNIFVLPVESLTKELENITKKYGDVEEALKKDPFLI